MSHEWSLAGRRLGTALVFFLIGADIYTAYTFVAIPSGVFAKGSLYFFAIPYVALTFGIALVTMPRLWSLSREKGYITASDFAKDRFKEQNSFYSNCNNRNHIVTAIHCVTDSRDAISSYCNAFRYS